MPMHHAWYRRHDAVLGVLSNGDESCGESGKTEQRVTLDVAELKVARSPLCRSSREVHP